MVSVRQTALAGKPLTPLEKRCIQLVALGMANSKIASEMTKEAAVRGEKSISINAVAGYINSAIGKLEVAGRVSLALRAADMMRAAWTESAEKRRAQLTQGLWFTRRRLQLLRFLAEPAHCDKTNVELGALCDVPMSGHGVSQFFGRAREYIGPNNCKAKLAVVVYLAPLSVEMVRLYADDDESP